MDKTLTDALALAAAHGLTDREVASAVEAATAARRDEDPAALVMVHPDTGARAATTAEAFEVHKLAGWQLADDDAPDGEDGLPKGNAARDEWADYAVRHGLTHAQVEPLSRDEIRDHFNEETP